MHQIASSIISSTRFCNVNVAFVKDQGCYYYHNGTDRIYVKGYRRGRSRPKPVHPFVIYNHTHLI